MIIIPAIDLKDGKCVRLRQGRMGDPTIFSEDPLEMAEKWVRLGGERLHIVDLDGAKEGRPVHSALITRIAQAYPHMAIQVGGGIRNEATVKAYCEQGVSFVIVGTWAVREPEEVKALSRKYPKRLMVSCDVRAGVVALSGWMEESSLGTQTFLKFFEDAELASLIYTDIMRDGMATGVHIEGIRMIASQTKLPLIIAGGVHTSSDIQKLLALNIPHLEGVIVGRALYEGSIDLAEVLKILC
ncbi:MAG: 1-(5-phosphoribosyl)-5-[(5-phosphoribosylamino)methylideneamino]imidazole-4-carboxamide isomerase [Gammaproteobacteria bacterium]|nr:1-(5-phosphoribosyl)-5-[(5-phosphoribosylamino)methylideneamino]imidazole-4-carboxamide isomerase [Gammaproteobacteria bacterium]